MGKLNITFSFTALFNFALKLVFLSDLFYKLKYPVCLWVDCACVLCIYMWRVEVCVCVCVCAGVCLCVCVCEPIRKYLYWNAIIPIPAWFSIVQNNQSVQTFIKYLTNCRFSNSVLLNTCCRFYYQQPFGKHMYTQPTAYIYTEENW